MTGNKFSTSLAALIFAISSTSAALAQDDIVVGVAGPMAGVYATLGDQFKRGVALAVEDVNKAGGLLGRKLRIEIGDDNCEAAKAADVAKRLVDKKAALVVGHLCSAASIAASAVYHEGGAIQITPGSTSPKFTDDAAAKNWRHVFRTCGRDDVQGATAANYIFDNHKGKKLAILHDGELYGKGLAEEMRRQFGRRGGRDSLFEGFAVGTTDFGPLVTKLRDAQIDVVYLGAMPADAGAIVKTMRERGLAIPVVGGDALVTEEFWKVSGKAGEGTVMTFEADPRKNPAAKEVVSRFRAGGFEPEGFAVYSYAAVQAWAQAVAGAKSLATTDVARTMRGLQFDTALGKIRFNAKGDRNNPEYVFYVWNDGKYREMIR